MNNYTEQTFHPSIVEMKTALAKLVHGAYTHAAWRRFADLVLAQQTAFAA